MSRSTFFKSVGALALAALLGGCFSSPKTQFIDLNSTTRAGAPATLDGAPLRLGQVRLAGALDRPYLVRQTGPNTRDVSNTARWIAPLDELIHDTLSTDLADQLDSVSFVADDDNTNRTTRTLIVFVQSLAAGPDNTVHLDARWKVLAGQNADNVATPSGRSRLDVNADGAKPGDIAAAMSRAIGQLSVRIVAALTHE